MNPLFTVLMAILLGVAGLQTVRAEEAKGRKEINFEGAVVEGVGRQSLDSLSQVSDGDAKQRMHLYERRDDYKDRDKERIDELIETY